MSDAEREEILAKLAAIKTTVVELENLLLPERRVFYSYAAMACKYPHDMHSSSLVYLPPVGPKGEE